MEHPVLTTIRRAGFTPLGWFTPHPDDKVPDEARFVILIGNAGADMYRRFARERDPSRDSMDEWTQDAVAQLAATLEAKACYPFDMSPASSCRADCSRRATIASKIPRTRDSMIAG